MAHTALESVGRVGLGHSFVSFHEATTTDNNVAQVVKQFALVMRAPLAVSATYPYLLTTLVRQYSQFLLCA